MSSMISLYFCTFQNCTAFFKKKTKFDIHFRKHNSARPFLCSLEECDKSFVSESHLKRHQLVHETEPLNCPIEGCPMMLKTQQTLNKHIAIVHEKKYSKKYKCTMCSEQFNKHNWLQRHMFRHTKVYPHVCPFEDCGKGFLLPSRLKKHMKIHNGYPCKIPGCNTTLSKWSHYVQHVREFHRPEYKCETCGKVFTLACNLKSHRQIHAESRTVYPCDEPNCTRYFMFPKGLRYHVKHYHEERPFVCSKKPCFKTFKTQEQLDLHVLYHDKKRPRKKKKSHKPSLAAVLAGCVEAKKTPSRRKVCADAEETRGSCDETEEGSCAAEEAERNCLSKEMSCVSRNNCSRH